jgi:hypothetical protein
MPKIKIVMQWLERFTLPELVLKLCLKQAQGEGWGEG